MLLWDLDLEIFAEGFRDKVFDTKIVAALGHALGDTHTNVRTSVVEFFTAAVVQGALHCFDRIFIPKYLQRGFGTKYLTLRMSLHLDVH